MKTFETDVIKLTLSEDGFAELVVKDNSVYDTKDIIDGKEFSISYLPGKKIYFLLEMEGDAYTTKEARELAADPEHGKHHGAVAIYSEKLAYKLLGNFYIRINKPKAPTRFFSRRDEAVKWLRDQMN
ncbi:MAG TPA: hypothetical protein VN026_11210 [Bacteroidia bacterium]|jgi:hypothetical protein|nr:hypothetical protein [Bacteroidia bacterium]